MVVGVVVAASSSPAVAAMALAVGIIYGTIVAVVPTVLGGFVVVVVLTRRHPRPASFNAVYKDLAVVFASVILALDLVVLVYWLTLGGSLSQVLVALAVLLLIDVATAALLMLARTSIARTWVGDSDRGAVAAVAPSHLDAWG